MLYKKFGKEVYERLSVSASGPDSGSPGPLKYQEYKTENGKDSLVISKNYTVLKQGKYLSNWGGGLLSLSNSY
jgi:hypothetical protein